MLSSLGPELGSILEAIKECSRTRNLSRGRELHSLVSRSDLLSNNIYVGNSLLNMYAKCKSMREAQNLFDTMPRRSAVSLNCLIQGYAETGHSQLALKLFDEHFIRRNPGNTANAGTFVAALTACCNIASAEKRCSESKRLENKVKDLHSQAIERKCSTRIVETMVIRAFGKCSSALEARRVFDKMIKRETATWNCMISCYVENGQSEAALELFELMLDVSSHQEPPDSRTYLAVLSACIQLLGTATCEQDQLEWIAKGKHIHSLAVASNCCNIYVGNALLGFYSKCRLMNEAWSVFENMPARDIVSWNTLLQGYVDNDQSKVALNLFDQLRAASFPDGSPDSVTLLTAISACAALAAKCGDSNRDQEFRLELLEKGKMLHRFAGERKCSDMFVETTLVELYARCGRMGDAREVFNGMPRRDVAAWNCLVRGYADNGENERALELFWEMRNERGLRRCWISFAAALAACGNLMSMELGKRVHLEARKCGVEKQLATHLVEFYGKCGSMEIAEMVFDSLATKSDVWAWNALLSGYSQLGNTNKAWEVFQKMRGVRGMKLNSVTFTHILTACSHSGDPELGLECFELMMSGVFGVKPDVIHYNCLVDMLSRANKLDAAVEVARKMSVEANYVTWTSILAGCLKWKNVELAEVAHEELLKIDEKNAVAYDLMANVYTVSSAAVDGEKMASETVWINCAGKIHKFVSKLKF